MDLVTHTLLSYKLIDHRPTTFLAGIGPDIPWYLTYPAWVIAQGKAVEGLATGEWPIPPRWIQTLHYACHSLPVVAGTAVLVRVVRGRWPMREVAAWILHILVDIPSHSRRFLGPRFLWPFSDFAVDGIPWGEMTARSVAGLLRILLRAPSASDH